MGVKVSGNILITGGAGFIGCNLVEYLLTIPSVNRIYVCDNLSSGRVDFLPSDSRVEFIYCDIENYEKLDKIFPDGIDFVFHLAAHFANHNSVDNPISDINTNILGSLNLLQVCKDRGVIKVINTSSSCLYGNLDIMSEDSKIYPIETPYAINKFTAEMYFTYFSHLYKLPTLNLRIFNTFGKYELAHRYRNVIPNFIDLALKNKPLTITGDGNETRDFTYVTDTIKLMVDMMDSELGDGDIFNAGTGKPTSIKYLAETIINKTNSKSEIIYKPRRNWDGVIDRLSDIEKSKVVFNYSPDITLEDGLDETIEWYSSVIF